MKLKPAYLLYFGAVLFFMPLAAQTKHALIFAIGNYKKNSGWHSLHSSTDAAVIKNSLVHQGFDSAHISIIENDSAYHKGIVTALNALTKRVDTGDIVVIHFSAHGEQLEDDNGDEIADGLDESIVSYDALYDANPRNFKNIQANYFRDDEFGEIIRRLRTKLGQKGHVLVILDACHSGTGTKGTAVVRGGMPKLVSETFDSKKWQKEDTTGVFMEANSIKGDKKGLASFVIISAARSEEVDWETDDDDYGPMGSLSNAIINVFAHLGTGITYRSLFAKIQSIMAKTVPGQHPVLEGDKDSTLFGGAYIPQKPFIEISSIEGKVITLKAGLLLGLDEGAKIVIDSSGTPDPTTVISLASGVVTKATPYSATVMLDKELRIKPVEGWAFITEPVYKTKTIFLKINPGFSASAQSAVQEALKELPLFKTGGEPELVLKKGPAWDSLCIASNGYLFDTIKNTSTARIKEKFQHYAQYKLLRDFETTDPSANVEVRMVPVFNGKADTSKIHTKVVNDINEYKEGDIIALWVSNKGKLPVYINLLDLRPDGVINAILPFKGYIEPEDLIINGGHSRIIKYVNKNNEVKDLLLRIKPPCGDEIFKVFVSDEPINMEMIANSPGLKGSFKPLENLVNNSYQVATKGPQNKNFSNADGSVYNLLFRIVSCKK